MNKKLNFARTGKNADLPAALRNGAVRSALNAVGLIQITPPEYGALAHLPNSVHSFSLRAGGGH